MIVRLNFMKIFSIFKVSHLIFHKTQDSNYAEVYYYYLHFNVITLDINILGFIFVYFYITEKIKLKYIHSNNVSNKQE